MNVIPGFRLHGRKRGDRDGMITCIVTVPIATRLVTTFASSPCLNRNPLSLSALLIMSATYVSLWVIDIIVKIT